MKQTKYITSGGLAFSEEKDMDRLSKYAKDGWILDSFAMLGYRLKKAEPADIQYQMDYQKGADEDYFSYFESAGWSHVCSAGNEIHVFSATPGARPIYTDKATIIEKYQREKIQFGKYALPFLILFVLFLFLIKSSNMGWIPEIAGTISGVCMILVFIPLIFTGMPCIAYIYKLYKLKNL